MPFARWTHLTRAYVGLLLVRVALLVAAVWLGVRQDRSSLVQDQALAMLVGVALGLAWLHQAWARIPRAHRRAYDGRRIEPDDALWKLFIPIYGVYWLFVANTGLCGAVERRLPRHHARSVSVPSTLGFIACLVQLVPVLNLVLSPFLWGLFMVRVDAAQAEADPVDPEGQGAESMGWLKVLGILVGAVFALWGMNIVTYFAIWQFLNPSRP